jgi:hypothetical protein
LSEAAGSLRSAFNGVISNLNGVPDSIDNPVGGGGGGGGMMGSGVGGLFGGGVGAGGASGGATGNNRQQQQQQQQQSPSPPVQKRLCIPSEERRAYVTVFSGSGVGTGGGGGGVGFGGGLGAGGHSSSSSSSSMNRDQLWGVRVLAQSLRESGAKGEVVVMLPASSAADRQVWVGLVWFGC